MADKALRTIEEEAVCVTCSHTYGDHSAREPNRCREPGCRCLTFLEPLHRISGYHRVDGRFVRSEDGRE